MHAFRPTVLVFSGLDPSGGAGMAADVEAIAAQGAHALPVVTVLTVQDNDRVHAIVPVDPEIVRAQVEALMRRVRIDAIKIGIVGSSGMAALLAEYIAACRAQRASLPVVLDPVLASGHGDALHVGDAVRALAPLSAQASFITPNLPELARLSAATPGEDVLAQLRRWMPSHSADVLLKGGHGTAAEVENLWCRAGCAQPEQRWYWPRLPGAFHGSGCTLAAALAGQLALGRAAEVALTQAQAYTQRTLERAFSIAAGQAIPARIQPACRS